MRRLAASHPDRGEWVRSHLQRQPRSDAPLAGGRARPAAQWSLFLGRLQLIRVADGGRVAMHPHANCQSGGAPRSEEHTSELQSLMRISYAVFCLQKKMTIPHVVILAATNTAI